MIQRMEPVSGDYIHVNDLAQAHILAMNIFVMEMTAIYLILEMELVFTVKEVVETAKKK